MIAQFKIVLFIILFLKNRTVLVSLEIFVHVITHDMFLSLTPSSICLRVRICPALVLFGRKPVCRFLRSRDQAQNQTFLCLHDKRETSQQDHVSLLMYFTSPSSDWPARRVSLSFHRSIQCTSKQVQLACHFSGWVDFSLFNFNQYTCRPCSRATISCPRATRLTEQQGNMAMLQGSYPCSRATRPCSRASMLQVNKAMPYRATRPCSRAPRPCPRATRPWSSGNTRPDIFLALF